MLIIFYYRKKIFLTQCEKGVDMFNALRYLISIHDPVALFFFTGMVDL